MTTDFTPLDPAAADRVADSLVFDDRGLLPAIAQDAGDGSVLMLAWMNREAVLETLTTGRVTYYSRSRRALWRKGESSGHVQALSRFRYDCDADTVLLTVAQTGPACHTNRRDCFFNEVRADGGVAIISEPLVDPVR